MQIYMKTSENYANIFENVTNYVKHLKTSEIYGNIFVKSSNIGKYI